MKANYANIKSEIYKMGKTLDIQLVNSKTDGTFIKNITSGDINYLSLHYDGGLLTSVMKQLDIQSNSTIDAGTVLQVSFNVSGESTGLGTYFVYSCEKQEDNNDYKIIAYDGLFYSMQDYEDLGLTYPITIRSYLKAICTKIGLSFDDTATFPNYDKQITKELYLDADGNSMGYTYRNILTEIAQATGGTICINDIVSGGKTLVIRYINNTGDTIDEKYFKDTNVSFGKKFGPINSLVLSRSADSDITDPVEDAQSISDNGICQIKIKDNQIMNWDDRETYMQPIFNVLDGVEYYINDCASTGIVYYDLLDKYNVSIGNNTYTCIMFNDEIIIEQGLEEMIHADEMKEYVAEVKKTSVEKQRNARASIIADQANASISQVVSAIGDNGEVTAGSIILAINGDTSQLSIDADKININGVISANGSFEVDTNGNMTCSNANITGGDISLSSTDITPRFTIISNSDNNKYANFYPSKIEMKTSNSAIHIFPDDILIRSGSYGAFSVNLGFEQLEFVSLNNAFKRFYINLSSNDPYFEISIDGTPANRTEIYGNRIKTRKIIADNIVCGTITLDSVNENGTTFGTTFANIPKIILTPRTTISGVIAPKVRSVSTTGFTAIIGGSVSGNIDCDWIAIDM